MSAEEFDTTMTPEEIEDAHRFWDEIILREDGVISLDNVYAELYDYMYLIEHAARVYDRITCGAISKPNTHAADVISQYEECSEKWTRLAILEALERVRDGEKLDDLLEEFKEEA